VPGGATLRVRVQPRASREAIVGERAGALAVRVTRPPAEGAANQAVVALLAARLRLPPSRIRIVRGASSRDKLLQFDGVGAVALRAALDTSRVIS
jgi:hypothetical protein